MVPPPYVRRPANPVADVGFQVADQVQAEVTARIADAFMDGPEFFGGAISLYLRTQFRQVTSVQFA